MKTQATVSINGIQKTIEVEQVGSSPTKFQSKEHVVIVRNRTGKTTRAQQLLLWLQPDGTFRVGAPVYQNRAAVFVGWA